MVQQSVTQYVLIVLLIELDVVLAVMSINEAIPLDKPPTQDSLNGFH